MVNLKEREENDKKLNFNPKMERLIQFFYAS